MKKSCLFQQDFFVDEKIYYLYFFLATLPAPAGFLTAGFFAGVFFATTFLAATFFAGSAAFLAPNFGPAVRDSALLHFGPLAIISRQSFRVRSLASFHPFGIL